MPQLFNSRDIAYRAPFGAVAENTTVLFRVCVPREWGCHGAVLLMQPDAQPRQDIGMFWAGMADDTHEWWDVRFTPEFAGVYWYAFRLELGLGTGWLTRQPDGTAGISHTPPSAMWQLTCYEAGFATPDWLAGGILYQIFPDRFASSGSEKGGVPNDRMMHRGWDEPVAWEADEQGKIRNNDFFGGDLKGIMQKLDYLQSLGVTCLYLNPIFEAHSNHRYDTADYSRVDPLLGDEQDVHALTREAKKRGIKVMLDGVFSHTGADSVYFNRNGRYETLGAYNSPVSPYSSWYRFRSWPRDYASWWGFETLPEVEELAPDFMDYINGEDGIVAHWLRAGAAGWRLDVADELPDGFLDALRARAKATDPDALVLGEVWEDASNKESYGHRRRYLLGKQLDSVMNYPFREAILRFLLQGGQRAFWDAVMAVVENYPPQVLRLLMNHIGTHDTERVLTLLGGEPSGGRDRRWQSAQRLSADERAVGLRRLRLATLLQFALPGVPCVYYGDEAGMEGYKDPFNRATYPWGREDTSLVEWYRALGACRRARSALIEGEISPVMTDGEDVVCFVRRGDGDALLVAVNRSEHERRIALSAEFARGEVIVGDARREGNVLVLPPLSGGWLRG